LFHQRSLRRREQKCWCSRWPALAAATDRATMKSQERTQKTNQPVPAAKLPGHPLGRLSARTTWPSTTPDCKADDHPCMCNGEADPSMARPVGPESCGICSCFCYLQIPDCLLPVIASLM